MEEVYELYLDENDDDVGVFTISLVEEPAIMTNFHYFNKEGSKLVTQFKTLNKEQRLVAGPSMIPDIEIPRQDAEGNPYAVTFSKETIKKAAYKFMKDKNISNVNVDHQESVPDVYVVESWLTEAPSKDKSSKWGFKLPKGSWFTIFKVENDVLWEDYVKSGKLKGFSVELQMSKRKKSNNFMKDNTNIFEQFAAYLKNTQKFAEEAKKEEELEKKEDEMNEEKNEDKVEMEEKEEKMEAIETPLGLLDLPEDFTGADLEIEALGKKWKLEIYEIATEEEVDPAEGDEVNPDEVVDELKKQVEEMKAQIDELKEAKAEKVKTKKTSKEGDFSAQQSFADYQNISKIFDSISKK